MSKEYAITIPTQKAWASKTKALDCYRWRQLRQRHTWSGAAIRTFRNALTDLFFGIFAWLKASRSTTNDNKCDFLLLQGSPKVIPLMRKKKLIELLRKNGHVLIEIAQETPLAILTKKMVSQPPQSVPLRYYGYAAYAEWLVTQYNPSILLNDRNGSLVSPFLRLCLNQRNCSLIHLAHASTLESSRRLDMTDYDYYFLFGQSSLNALQTRPLRLGDTRAVLSGSHMIDKSYSLPPAAATLKTLLVLGVGPDKEKESGYQKTYELIKDWAAKKPDFKVLIKAHPRSNTQFWNKTADTHINIEVLPRTCTLAKALSQASIVLNIMSNAVIEAALTQRPIIYVNKADEPDIFDQVRYFGAAINSTEALTARIEYIQTNYMCSIENSIKFSEFHLERGALGLEHTYQLLTELLSNNRISYTKLNSTI